MLSSARSPASASSNSADGLIRHLFVPGLLGPVPGVESAERPAVPRLETLLARADRSVEPVGYAAGLFALFGVDRPVGADLPTAAVAFLGETGEVPGDFLLHADPLRLLPDRDRLLAFDLDNDPLDGDEIASLVAAFNAHYAADGMHLHGRSMARIYLRCDQVPSIETHPLSAVLGRNLDPFLPEGRHRRRWHGLLNETQMLCHSLDFNRAREAGGRPTLDGLWFSGGGRLPPGGQGPIGRLVGDDDLPRGLLALCAGGGDELIIDLAPRRAVMRADRAAWLQAISGLEGRIGGLLGGCEELQVHPGNGVLYRWRSRSARRWWRRTPPLFSYLDAGDGRRDRCGS